MRLTTGTLAIKDGCEASSTPATALNAGVAIIYQELHLVPEMTVAENIYLGQLPHKSGIVNRSLLNYEAGLQLEHLGLISTHRRRSNISPSASGRWLKSQRRWHVMPKLSPLMNRRVPLSAREIENLFRVIRELRKEGRVILYVSHRMEEIFALSDAITVFKDGRYVRTFTDMQQVNHDQLVQAMVGRDLGISTAGSRATMARSGYASIR